MDARRWRSLFVAARPGRMKAAGRWGHSRASVRSAPIRDQRKSRGTHSLCSRLGPERARRR
jgi:hypothetical protein